MEEEYKYLGFTISNKGRYEEHIKELRRKSLLTVRKVWSLGERICRNDFKRKWMLFSTEHYGIWSENLGMGRDRRVGKNDARLY